MNDFVQCGDISELDSVIKPMVDWFNIRQALLDAVPGSSESGAETFMACRDSLSDVGAVIGKFKRQVKVEQKFGDERVRRLIRQNNLDFVAYVESGGQEHLEKLSMEFERLADPNYWTSRRDFTEECIRFAVECFALDPTRTSMSFPTLLNNYERYVVHSTAQDLGMQTASTGRNRQRFVTVRK